MRKIFGAAALLFACFVAAVAQSPAPSDAVKDIAPTGKLRAAINFVNTVIAQRDPASGEPMGVSADLARELARRLGVPIEFVLFEGAGREFDAAKTGVWDIGFFAIDPVREVDVDYTPPYVIIEGGYLVRKDSPVQSIADVDKKGTRIAVGNGSVYDHYLTSTLKNAQLIRQLPADMDNVLKAFFDQKLEVAAFISIPLANYAKGNPDVRMVDGVFMKILQAMAMPKGRGEAGRRYLNAFIEDVKASGFVEESLKRSGRGDAAVAPPATTGCEPLSPLFRSDSSRVVQEKISPNGSDSPTGNTYFLMRDPYKYVIVHLNPTSSDTGNYLVKLITRYMDDTIYEPVVKTIIPKAGGNYEWGPLLVMPSAVPKDKVPNMFNVKVQENYALNPEAKGFSYTVSVDGCN
jgi:polar amino acid transport system substrate-binding protein